MGRLDCSVIIATYNRAQVLRVTLERLQALSEAPRIVVVDNGSTDNTGSVARSFAGVTYVPLANNIGAAARTIGARHTADTYVAFCDDDCTWTDGSLERAAQRLDAHGNVAVINARVLVGSQDVLDPACAGMSGSDSDIGAPGIPIVFFMAGASVMRRAAFLDAGGYHARYFIGAEESLLALDLASRGWDLWYCDDIVVRHTPCSTNRDPAMRRRLVQRNRLWTALLRHSTTGALSAVLRQARAGWSDPLARAALIDAMRGLPWVLRERRPIPRELERRARAIEPTLHA